MSYHLQPILKGVPILHPLPLSSLTYKLQIFVFSSQVLAHNLIHLRSALSSLATPAYVRVFA
jgi:hypothetical protein